MIERLAGNTSVWFDMRKLIKAFPNTCRISEGQDVAAFKITLRANNMCTRLCDRAGYGLCNCEPTLWSIAGRRTGCQKPWSQTRLSLSSMTLKNN